MQNISPNSSGRIALYGLIIAQYQPKNQTVPFSSNFLLPPSICTQTGNHSLHGGRVNPAGCGKLLNRKAAGWQTRALKRRQSTRWLHRLVQHIRGANERRMGKRGDGFMQHNTRGLVGSSSEGVTNAFIVCSHIVSGPGQSSRRWGTIAYEGSNGNGTANEEMCYLFYWCGLLRRLCTETDPK